ncbi:2-amino-3-ketobutyrate coenzyme A ligase, mitochondrial [Arapaima gigas]
MDFLMGDPFDSPLGRRIEQATSSTLQSEDWALNMEICDIVNETEEGPKDAVKAIKKRIIGNRNFKEVMLTLTVLEACVKNCGHRFHILVSTREFVEGVLVRAIMTKNNPPVVVHNRVLALIQTWADAFRSSSSLTGVVSVYEDLKRKGVEFPVTTLNCTSPIHTPDRRVPGDRSSVSVSPLAQNPCDAPVSPQHPMSASRNETPLSITPAQVEKLRAELEVVRGNTTLMTEMMNQLKLDQVQPSDAELLQQLHSMCLGMQDRVVKLIPVASDEKLMEELLELNDELNTTFAHYTDFQKHLSGQRPAEQIPAATCTDLVDLSRAPHVPPASQQPEGQSAVNVLSSHMANLSARDGDGRATFTQGRNDLFHMQSERYSSPGGQTGEELAKGLNREPLDAGLGNTQDSTVLSSSPSFDWMVEKGMIPVSQTNAMDDIEQWLADSVDEDATDNDGVTSKDILNFCANNYLGLSSHPEVVQAGVQALQQYGAGLSSVRFICGTQDLHKRLEQKLAQFHEREDAILYASCFDANAGLFEVLLGPDDAVLSDELNHASIIDGIRLCRAKRLRYRHMDLNDLENKLKESQSCRLRLVATDGVFSMDGDVAPLREICDLAERYRAMVFIDECHATGFMGPRGRGTDELLGVMDKVHIVNSTLGKALGGAAGGYTVGPKPLIDLLRQRSRPYLFSNSLPPPVVGCSTRAVELLLSSNEIAQSMAAKTKRFRDSMSEAGFTISGSNHPICPVMLGDARLASLMADDMLKLGVYVIGFSYPVVPKGKARIRVQISAAHSDQDIDRCVDAFIQTGRKHGVVS